MNNTSNNTNPTPANGISNSRLAKHLVNSTFDGAQAKVINMPKVIQAASPAVADEQTKPVVKKWARKPAKMYDRLFGGKSLSNEQIKRQAISKTVEFAPQSVIGLLQMKIKGAQSRIVSQKNAIQTLRVILKTRTVEKKGKAVGISPSEKKSYQQQKLKAEVKLMEAKGDLSVFRMNLADAMQKNATPLRENIKAVREMAYIRKMAPSISQQVIDFVESQTGVKEELINLKGSASENVADGFWGILKGYNEKKRSLLAAKPKLATQVRQNVFAHLSKTATV